MVQIILQPLAIPGTPFTWHSGEKWAVAYSFQYLALAGETADVYLDIKDSGNPLAITRHLAHETLTLAAAIDPNNPATKTSTLTLTVPSTDISISIGTYDLILNVGGTSISEPGAVNIQAGSGHFDLVKSYDDPNISSYQGYVDEGTYGFNLGPNEIPFMDSALASMLTNNLISEAKKKGADLLSYKLYRDTSSIAVTPYQIDITFKSPLQTASTTALGLVQPQLLGLDDAAAVTLIGYVLIALGIIAAIVTVVVVMTHTSFGKAVGGVFNILGEILPMLILIVIMKMMMEGMQPAGTPKPVTETVVKGAKAVGKGVGYVVDKGAPIVGKAITGVTTAVTRGVKAGQQQDNTPIMADAYSPTPYEEGYGI
jgi:Flp pilus assembly pilin Flp